jgi:Transposase IS66 family
LVEAMLADVLGIEISLGSTQKAWEEVSQAVQQPVEQLQKQLPREAVLNVDETGWRTSGDRRWLWALAAKQFVLYVMAATRGAEVLASLLGAVYRGILCNDRWVAYLSYHSGNMQLCWAHLKRNILELPIMRVALHPSASARMHWPLWPACSGCGIGFAATCETGAEIRSRWTGGNSSKNQSPCRRSYSHWRRRIWTTPTATCATWRRRCSFTPKGCSRFWSMTE